MAVKDIILGLSNANGPSGAEGSAARLAMELLSDFTPTVRDSLGNVMAELGDLNSPDHILIDAHIDEIGLVVTDIDDNGFLHIAKCGGVDRRVMMGSEVCVMSKNKINGVICCRPPHLTRDEDVSKVPDFKDMAPRRRASWFPLAPASPSGADPLLSLETEFPARLSTTAPEPPPSSAQWSCWSRNARGLTAM